MKQPPAPLPSDDRSPWAVFLVFLRLGLTSFGGPIAHLGYFRDEFVLRRQWLSERAYADLIGLCQFLPGPASSQIGIALGLGRAGYGGALAAWLGFTLPSAIALILFASLLASHGNLAAGALMGLKVVAVAVVAQAVWGMARTLCPDRLRVTMMAVATAAVLLMSSYWGQLLVLLGAGVVGMLLIRPEQIAESDATPAPVSRTAGMLALTLFFSLLLLLPLLAALHPEPLLVVADTFYRVGSLVFGGGHVVLPLLEAELVQSGWVAADDFLTGYGAAQAVPGPLFTFAAYLGTLMAPLGSSLFGASLALLMIFLPGMLLLVAVLPHWNRFRRWGHAQALMRGANAAVVGILGAALYHPVWTSAILGPYEFTLALTGFLLLSVWKLPAWTVVIVLAGGGIIITL